ncbi:endonuclease I [Gillisia mitskevichiae]|uniref:Endonuclease I n=1 Tax=Gillisia mitskevichiae TaxID=270921 RepID=A0A495PYQ1_9FLAO|nr:endonuclease [Gillisia mitskevichiae]RKS55519.1 endonuclease I [Gillisia mitskevichiae]
MKKFIYILIAVFIVSCSTDDGGTTEKPTPPVSQDKPVALNDTAETVEDESVVISDLLSNDTVTTGARITSADTNSSKGGSVTDNRNGSYTYTPTKDFVGEETFTYKLCDQDSNCSTATVTITVNDAGSPDAVDDEVKTVTSVSLTITNLASNDDITDDATITSVDGSASSGTVTLNSNGSVTYVPANGFKGEDSFTYSLCDDDEVATCSTATVKVTVLDPVALNIPNNLKSYYEDLAITIDGDLNYEFVSDHTIKNHTTILSYGQRHEYLYNADADLTNSDNVILMYTGESRYYKEYTSGSNSYSPQTFNTEHIFPQSKLNSEGAVTDLHHLRSADADINSLRSNYEYTDGSGSYKLINENSWFPGDEWKGDVARMVLYLNVRYGEEFVKVGGLDLLLKWNREDPVSAFEMQRNEVIYAAQGNRNIFIDNPYIATLIWGGASAENKWD